MASFWQNKADKAGCNNKKSALENILSGGVSFAATKTKIEEADLLNSQNELEKAYGIYKDILGENPRQADALFGIGVILEKQQKFDLAIQFLYRAIESNPSKVQALLTRGRILRLQGMTENAILDFTKIIAKYPDNFEALIARGIAFGQTCQFSAAIDDFTVAIRINPNCTAAFYNRGVVHEKLHEYESAIDDYSIAIKLNPNDYKAYNNRGVARRELKCFCAALEDFEQSIKINPDFAEGYYNKSLTLLSIGKLKEGFKLYEYRWKTAHFQSQIRHFSPPLWLGNSDLTGKTILLHSEQGLGDSIQFCRYIKFFKNIKCQVLLEIEKPLMSLMQSLLPKECIFEKGSRLPKFDYHCPLMSLPFALQNQNHIHFHGTPYLTVSKREIGYWEEQLKGFAVPAIGLAWRGNPNHPKDQCRSTSLKEFIGHLPRDIQWVSLHNNISLEEKRLMQGYSNFTNYPKLGDFRQTGALCLALDGIVSVDTSIAHLAGSLGQKVHLILGDFFDYRWDLGSNKTPWYEKHRIVKKQKTETLAEAFIRTSSMISHCAGITQPTKQKI